MLKANQSMVRLIILLFFILCWAASPAQDIDFEKADVQGQLINSGKFADYTMYDLGSYIFYNGVKNNRLKYFIQEKKSDKILYTTSDTASDAMILKPSFFSTGLKNKPYIIMVEVAAEYSWGQDLLLIKSGKAYHPGYLNYAVDKENGVSVSGFSHFKLKKNKIILKFDDVPIVDWGNENKVLNGKDLLFEIDQHKIVRIK
jgi:hypothetical protein